MSGITSGSWIGLKVKSSPRQTRRPSVIWEFEMGILVFRTVECGFGILETRHCGASQNPGSAFRNPESNFAYAHTGSGRPGDALSGSKARRTVYRCDAGSR